MINNFQEKCRRYFYCSIDRVRKFDNRGRIVSDGVRWNEERVCYFGGLFVITMGIFAALVISTWKTPIPGRAFLAIFAGVSLVGIGSLMFAYRFRECALIFTDDGRILTPHGFPGYPFLKMMEGVHDNIDSIGIRLTELRSYEHGKPYGVMMYSKGGDIIRITSDMLHHDDAYKIAVLLNHALNSFR